MAKDAGAFKIVRGRRGSLPMWTSLGAKPVAALTELLYANSTWEICASQLSVSYTHLTLPTILRVLLAVGRQVAVGEVMADQALVTGDPGAFENREREARKPAHVDLVGS